MNPSIMVSRDTGTADVYPVISSIRWVIVDLQHRRIVGWSSRLLYVISPVNTKRSGFLNDLLVKHLHMKAYIKG